MSYDVQTSWNRTTKIQSFLKFAKRFQKKGAFHTQNALCNTLALNVP